MYFTIHCHQSLSHFPYGTVVAAWFFYCTFVFDIVLELE